MRFLGGPGMLSRTSLASLDFFMMTSLSRSAVCMRLTFDWFLLTVEGQSGSREGKRHTWSHGQIVDTLTRIHQTLIKKLIPLTVSSLYLTIDQYSNLLVVSL